MPVILQACALMLLLCATATLAAAVLDWKELDALARNEDTKDYMERLAEYDLFLSRNNSHRFASSDLANVVKEMKVTAAKKFFVKFGYKRRFSGEVTKQMIKDFQTNANIKVTGKLDKRTMRQMMQPRCAHRDPLPREQNITRRQRRYVRQGTKWSNEIIKRPLTWQLKGRGRTLEASEVQGVMRKAFWKWSAVTNLDFKECTDCKEVDIWVVFRKYGHEDAYSFDGPGGTLAHAFYPLTNKGLSGDVHFDDSETFTIGKKSGRNLLFVATHEIGHSIGLEHSNVQDAIMFPWYQAYDPENGINLAYDDRAGIQSIYGSRQKPTPKPEPEPTTSVVTEEPLHIPSDKECPTKIDAATYLPRYNTQALFTGADETGNQKIIFIRGKKIYPAFGRESYFPTSKIPGNIDAAVMLRGIRTTRMKAAFNILFSGTDYYLYEGFTYRGGPFSIGSSDSSHHKFNLLNLNLKNVKKIDGAMLFRNKRLYIFVGILYYRYKFVKNRKKNQGTYKQKKEIQGSYRMDHNYPKLISPVWKMPSKVDAMFAKEKLTYFIKGNKIHKLDDKLIHVAKGYPQHFGYKWLNCGGKDAVPTVSTSRR